jgi:hypothetical protein
MSRVRFYALLCAFAALHFHLDETAVHLEWICHTANLSQCVADA